MEYTTTKERTVPSTARTTEYAVQWIVDDQPFGTPVPVDTMNPEDARGMARDEMRGMGIEVSHDLGNYAKFLRNGRPYSNLRGGYYDDVVEIQLDGVRAELTGDWRGTLSFAGPIFSGRGRGIALSLLLTLYTRGEVERRTDGRTGSYEWRRV